MRFLQRGLGHRPLETDKNITYEYSEAGIVKKEVSDGVDPSNSLKIMEKIPLRHRTVSSDSLSRWR